MANLAAWTAIAFVGGLLVGGAVFFPGDITHVFSAPGSKGQVLMHFRNDGPDARQVQVTLRDGAGRTILDESINAGPHRTTDRAAVNLLAGSYRLVVTVGGSATASEALDVASCRGSSYFEVTFDVTQGVSAAQPECVSP